MDFIDGLFIGIGMGSVIGWGLACLVNSASETKEGQEPFDYLIRKMKEIDRTWGK